MNNVQKNPGISRISSKSDPILIPPIRRLKLKMSAFGLFCKLKERRKVKSYSLNCFPDPLN